MSQFQADFYCGFCPILDLICQRFFFLHCGRLRVLARAVSAFLSLRVSSPDKIHLDPSASKFPFPTKTTYGGDLVALRRNKAYARYSEVIEESITLCQDPSQTVLQVLPLVQRLTTVLFPDRSYLRDIINRK